ncbi:MAG: class I SAM-dependent methyltransferase [Phycisphaerales bacterium]
MKTSQRPSPKKAMDYAAEFDWPGYFAAVANKGARETLLRALELFEKEDTASKRAGPIVRSAVDIGCGEGRDTRELLSRAGSTKWKVLATDGSEEGLRLLAGSIDHRDLGRVSLRRCAMESMPNVFARGVRVGRSKRASPGVDLVNASFSLPFCRPSALPGVWRWIDGLIRPGGRFSGQLFGDRDSWAHARKTTGVSRSRLDRMFKDFVFEELREEEKDDRTAMDELKHWHVYHIVARKR